MIFDKLAMELAADEGFVRREWNCGIVVGEGRNNHYAIDKYIRKACEQSGDD